VFVEHVYSSAEQVHAERDETGNEYETYDEDRGEHDESEN
jgi:hypothetical protein